MTNSPIDSLIALASRAIDPDDESPFDAYDAILNLRPLLDTHHFLALCAAFELCPIHECTLDICADDDEPACRQYRD